MTSSSAPHLPAPLVSTQWLADHLGSEEIVVLDAGVLYVQGFDGRYRYLSGEDQYLVDGHVPGAVFADLIEGLSDPGRPFGFARPTVADLEAALSALGIDADTTVVVYDSSVGQWAARVWWLLHWLGHDRAAVLDGGLTAWRAEEREIETGHRPPRSGRIYRAAEERPVWVEKSEVERIVAGDAPGSLVCALPAREFAGETGYRPRLGHIPGSFSVPASRLVDRESATMLPPARLRSLFGDALASDRVVAYCSGGVAAAADALALTVLGVRDVVVYDGSLNEWAADPEAPIVGPTTAHPEPASAARRDTAAV